jgi:hypothetical protein
MRTLVIQREYAQVESSIPWSYSIRGDFYSALLRFCPTDVHYSLDPSETEKFLSSLTKASPYTHLVFNDINHLNIWRSDYGVTHPSLSLALLKALRKNHTLVFRCVETLFHRDDHDDVLNERRVTRLIYTLPFIDYLLVSDYGDYLSLLQNEVRPDRIIYLPFTLSIDVFSDLSKVNEIEINKPDIELLFIGSMYDKRTKFLLRSEFRSSIVIGQFSDNHFNSVHNQFVSHIASLPTKALTIQEWSDFEKARYDRFKLLCHVMRRAKVIVNLPAIYRGNACRVIESIASGSISVSPNPQFNEEKIRLKGERVFLYEEAHISSFDQACSAALQTFREPDSPIRSSHVRDHSHPVTTEHYSKDLNKIFDE